MSKSYRKQLEDGDIILVVSTNVHLIQWDKKTKTLTVSFYNQRTYTYDKVPLDIAEQLVKAKSKGKFMHEFIIDEYETNQIT